MLKHCSRCQKDKELNEDNFYPARPRKNHKKAGWQSYCKECWKDINKEQRIKRISVGQFYTEDEKNREQKKGTFNKGTLYEVKGKELVKVEKELIN